MTDTRTQKIVVLVESGWQFLRRVVGLFVASLLAGAACYIDAATAEQTGYTYSAERVFAVGDVHGAYGPLVELLRANQLIDNKHHWSGGATHLVSLGDLVDRGPRSRDVMDLMQRLQVEAKAAGGRVHVLLGNHEVMNLTGDLRDVSDAEFAAFADSVVPASDPDAATLPSVKPRPAGYSGHRRAFAADGKYGSWLMSLPLIIQINDTLFTHAGLSPLLGDRSLATLNGIARSELKSAVSTQNTTPLSSSLLGDDGLLWYRGSAACHPLLEEAVLQKQLAGLSARRLVIGHTPTPTRRVRERLGGQVVVIDTGMLERVYRGAPFLLALNSSPSSVAVLNASAQSSVPEWWHPMLTQPAATEESLVPAVLAGEELRGQWVTAGKKTIQRRLALWRLDRELQLWMTPMAVADVSGKRYFEVSRTGPEAWITERQRREQGRSYPNYCADGHPNLLITAFDALTGVTTRSLDTLLVHRATGTRRLAAIKRPFGTSSVLPRYSSAPTLPAAMASRLRALTAERVRELLGEFLTERQLKALLLRRDKILQWPPTQPTISPHSTLPAQKEPIT